jgi:hypothetical protein
MIKPCRILILTLFFTKSLFCLENRTELSSLTPKADTKHNEMVVILDEAFSIIKEHSIANIDWDQYKLVISEYISQSNTTDINNILPFAINELNDKHSFFLSSDKLSILENITEIDEETRLPFGEVIDDEL